MPLFQEASWSIEAAASSYGFITYGKPPPEYFYAIVLLLTKALELAHTVPQEGQKKPVLNSIKDCARKIPLFF